MNAERGMQNGRADERLELGAWSLEHGASSESDQKLNTDLRKNLFTEPPSCLLPQTPRPWRTPRAG